MKKIKQGGRMIWVSSNSSVAQPGVTCVIDCALVQIKKEDPFFGHNKYKIHKITSQEQ